MKEVWFAGCHSGAALNVSHTYCGGADNWQMSEEVLPETPQNMPFPTFHFGG
jgi:hypothetical protein